MAAIHTELSALAQTSAEWLAAAPTEPGVPPVGTPGMDPVSVAVSAAVADWPAVHESLVARRATNAAELTVANTGTASIIDDAETSNVALIANSGPED